MTARKDNPSSGARIRVMKRDRFQCTYCGTPGTDAELEVDHIIPVAKGGSHHISNLTTACRKCNQEKGTKEMQPNSPRSGSILVGLYLHTLDSVYREIEYQGQVIREDGEMVLVQLYSWMHGGATSCKMMKKELVLSDLCILYNDAESWRDNAEFLERKAEPAREARRKKEGRFVTAEDV